MNVGNSGYKTLLDLSSNDKSSSTQSITFKIIINFKNSSGFIAAERYLQAEMTNAQQNIETPFNEEFCTRLEYRICHELEKSTDPELKGFWCDGVSWFPSENQLTKKQVNDKRKIETKAWIGKTGQTEFKANIHFGRTALSKYSKGLDLTETIPELESDSEWIEIDVEQKTIKIFLK